MPNISFTYLIHLHYSYPFVNSSISFLLLTPKSMITMHSLRRCLLIQLIEMMSKLKCGFVVAVTVICPTATVGYLHHAICIFQWKCFSLGEAFLLKNPLVDNESKLYLSSQSLPWQYIHLFHLMRNGCCA